MITDFIAIDFETANNSRISAVSIGITPVVNGEIDHEKCQHHYICPPENKFEKRNTDLHGITWEDVKDAPNFKELWDSSLSSMLNKQLVFFHGASTDKACLEQLFTLHGIQGEFNYVDTQTLSRRFYSLEDNSLETLCQHFNVSLENHHDALCDAKACAEVALKMLSELGEKVDGLIQPSSQQAKPKNKFAELKQTHQKIKRDILTPDFEDVEDKNNPFYKKKVVISGTYENWPNRNDLAQILKSLGADINSGVTTGTNILIAGAGVGPKKLEKMQANIDSGKDAVVLYEDDIKNILESNNSF